MKITLSGRGPVLGINLFSNNDYLEYNIIIEGVTLTTQDEDITKRKGKYVKGLFITDDIVKYIGIDNVEDIKLSYKWFEFETEFELPDEDFDPKQIQLIKSDYEFREIPYAILTDRILYKGQEYITDTDLYEYAMIDFADAGDWYGKDQI